MGSGVLLAMTTPLRVLPKYFVRVLIFPMKMLKTYLASGVALGKYCLHF